MILYSLVSYQVGLPVSETTWKSHFWQHSESLGPIHQALTPILHPYGISDNSQRSDQIHKCHFDGGLFWRYIGKFRKEYEKKIKSCEIYMVFYLHYIYDLIDESGPMFLKSFYFFPLHLGKHTGKCMWTICIYTLLHTSLCFLSFSFSHLFMFLSLFSLFSKMP